MGSNTSKLNETVTQTQKNDLEVDENPDPRSPTPEISRTPLQGKTGSKHNITKNVDLSKTFDCVEAKEKLIHNNPILSAVIKNHLQSYDPRSPSQEFDRTPIVLTSNVDDDNNLYRRQTETSITDINLNDTTENCEIINTNDTCRDSVVPKNLCHGFYDLTLDDSFKETEEPLGSSTTSNEAIENNMSNGCENKPTKLLETNFDYIENHTDEDVSNVDKCAFEIKSKAVFKVLNEDPRSPSVGIQRTPIIVSNIDEDSPQSVEEIMDDALIKVLQNTNLELRNTTAHNVTVQDPDGLLIYEDDTSKLNETPKKSKSSTNSDARTPLSCMRNKDAGHNRSKSANTYDPKNKKLVPPKPTNRSSHIPRLKSLSKQSKLQTGSSISLKNIPKASAVIGDCENTPPHSHRDRWDKDISIVL